MKQALYILSIAVLAACGTQKNATSKSDDTTKTETTESSENYRIIGVVHTSETGCKLYIDGKLKDKTAKMYPVNLDEKYKKDGTRLKFAYQLSRAPLPEGCDAEMTVSVSDVTLMRGN